MIAKPVINPTTKQELADDEKEYTEESKPYTDPLYKPWWKSFFSDEQAKYFTHVETIKSYTFVQALSAAMWSVCVWILVGAMKKTPFAKEFLPYFALFAAIPYITIGANLVARVNEGDFQPHAPPEYPACMTPGEKLTDEQQRSGVVASINGHCFLTQYNYLQSASEVVRVKSYNLMYALFSLVLLFFTFSGYKKMFRADDPFIRETIRIASMISLILFTASVLGTYYWYSLFVIKFYNNAVQMNVSAVLILVSYLLFIMVRKVL